MIPLIGPDYAKYVIPLVDGAKRNIDIVVYDWRWYEGHPGLTVQQFNMALVRAVRRGVHVRAVLNVADIVPLLCSVGIKARRLSDARVLHSKMVVVDSSTLVIGSHNFTKNAFYRNLETSVIVEIPVEVTRFSEFFNHLYGL